MLSDFLASLSDIAPLAGNLTHSFFDGHGKVIGFAQMIPEYQNQVIIHRIWTLEPRRGNGSIMLKSLCELADQHRIILRLKVTPLGAKPYPFTRDQLVAWYTRHGFEGKRRKMLRMPRPRPLIASAAAEMQVSM